MTVIEFTGIEQLLMNIKLLVEAKKNFYTRVFSLSRLNIFFALIEDLLRVEREIALARYPLSSNGLHSTSDIPWEAISERKRPQMDNWNKQTDTRREKCKRTEKKPKRKTKFKKDKSNKDKERKQRINSKKY